MWESLRSDFRFSHFLYILKGILVKVKFKICENGENIWERKSLKNY